MSEHEKAVESSKTEDESMNVKQNISAAVGEYGALKNEERAES
jgi:hypothetical protein